MFSSIFLIPISIYFFSLIFFIYGVRYGIKNKSKKLNSSTKSKNIDCSIILCVRNGEESISKILNDFKNQTFSGRHEFIIVDDNSTDNSAIIIQDYANIDQRFKYIKSNSDRSNLRFKKKALNAGINVAKYDYLLFTDVDCRVGPNWISSMLENYQNNEYIIGYSGTLPSNTIISKFQSIDFQILMISAYSSASLGYALACSGQNQSYKKSLFKSVEGFSSIEHLLQGDDSLFLQICRKIKKIKVKFSIHPDSFVESKTHISWKEFIIQRMRWSGDANIMWKFNISFFIIVLSTFLTNLFILIGFISLIISPFFMNYFIIVLLIKFLLEFSLYILGIRKLNIDSVASQFPIWFFIQIPYVVLMGILSFFTYKLSWRGRTL